MSFSDVYLKRSKLMLQVLASMPDQPCFALKGGTAINYFYNQVPRISVDIDLVFLPIIDRHETISSINNNLDVITNQLKTKPWHVVIDKPPREDSIAKINIDYDKAYVKIETNGIFRGTAFPSERKAISKATADLHEVEAFSFSCSSFEDIYAGKFCAALTRQHPRDLFDILHFFKEHTITEPLRQAFVVYMCSDRRPFHEILSPHIKNNPDLFDGEFDGMTYENLTHDILPPVVNKLADTLIQSFTSDEKAFMLSMAQGDPDWTKLPFTHIKSMPALQWKLMNVRAMTPGKRKEAYTQLSNVLGLSAHDLQSASAAPSLTEIQIPALGFGVNKKEIAALIKNEHAALKQVGQLLQGLADGSKPPEDENWRFFPNLLKALVRDPIHAEHLERVVPQMYNKAMQYFLKQDKQQKLLIQQTKK